MKHSTLKGGGNAIPIMRGKLHRNLGDVGDYAMNAGIELGILGSWTGSSASVVNDSANAHSGSYAAKLSDLSADTQGAITFTTGPTDTSATGSRISNLSRTM